MLKRVCEYLDAPALGMAECSCSHLKSVCHSNDMWRKTAIWDIALEGSRRLFAPVSVQSTKNAIKMRSGRVDLQVKHLRESRLRAASTRAEFLADININRWMHYCVLLPLSLVMSWMPLLALLFICLKLDHRVSWSWWRVFTPLILLFVSIFVGCLASAVLWYVREWRDDKTVVFDRSMFKWLTEQLTRSPERRRGVLCVVPSVCGMIVWSVLIPAKLDGMVSMEWRAVFVPFWIAISLISAVALADYPSLKDVSHAILFLIDWWLIPVTVTLTVRADMDNMGLAVALIPMWIAFTLVFGLLCWAFLMAVKGETNLRERCAIASRAIPTIMGVMTLSIPVILIQQKSTGMDVSYSAVYSAYLILLAAVGNGFTFLSFRFTKQFNTGIRNAVVDRISGPVFNTGTASANRAGMFDEANMTAVLL